MNQFLTLLLCTVFCLSAESKKLADLRHALLFKVQNMNQFRQLKNEISDRRLFFEDENKCCQAVAWYLNLLYAHPISCIFLNITYLRY